MNQEKYEPPVCHQDDTLRQFIDQALSERKMLIPFLLLSRPSIPQIGGFAFDRDKIELNSSTYFLGADPRANVMASASEEKMSKCLILLVAITTVRVLVFNGLK